MFSMLNSIYDVSMNLCMDLVWWLLSSMLSVPLTLYVELEVVVIVVFVKCSIHLYPSSTNDFQFVLLSTI
jgi:hypothetical protein